MGRQYSMPASGHRTLTEIEYAPDDVPRRSVPSSAPPPSERPGGVRVAEGDIEAVSIGNVGGEMLEAEQLRRKGRAPEPAPLGAVDPATGAAAEQQAARVDPAGRADEAAARAMHARTPERDAALPHQEREEERGHSGPRNPATGSERDAAGDED
jgi:hypothetical protein